MSAIEKVVQLPLTPRDLVLQFLSEAAATPGSDLDWEPKFAKAIQTRYRGLLFAALIEYAQLVSEGKIPKKAKPKASTDLEKVMQKAAREARRTYLAGQVDAAADKRVLMSFIMPNGKMLGKCTLDYVARVGGAFQKLGKFGVTKQTIEQVYSERDLEKLGAK